MSEKDKQLTAYSGYDELQARQAAAYEMHLAGYKMLNPMPEKPPSGRWSIVPIVFALGIVLIGSMIVSATRTIHEFGDVGVPAFFMLEVAAVLIAYLLIVERMESGDVVVSLWMKLGLIIAIIVLISGNVDAVLSRTFELPYVVELGIHLAIALSAPLMTLIVGEILGITIVRHRKRQDELTEEYKAETVVWREGFNRSWHANKAKLGVRLEVAAEPVRIHSQRSLPEYANEQGEQYSDIHSRERSVNAANGYRKNMNASDLIREFLNDNSERSELWTMTADEFHGELLNVGIRVGRTKAYEIRRELDAQR